MEHEKVRYCRTVAVLNVVQNTAFSFPCKAQEMADKLVEKCAFFFKNFHFTTNWILNPEQMIITMMTTMMMVIGDWW